jgi:hypothetical protein
MFFQVRCSFCFLYEKNHYNQLYLILLNITESKLTPKMIVNLIPLEPHQGAVGEQQCENSCAKNGGSGQFRRCGAIREGDLRRGTAEPEDRPLLGNGAVSRLSR